MQAVLVNSFGAGKMPNQAHDSCNECNSRRNLECLHPSKFRFFFSSLFLSFSLFPLSGAARQRLQRPFCPPTSWLLAHWFIWSLTQDQYVQNSSTSRGILLFPITLTDIFGCAAKELKRFWKRCFHTYKTYYIADKHSTRADESNRREVPRIGSKQKAALRHGLAQALTFHIHNDTYFKKSI